MHQIIIVPSIVPLFTSHLHTAADAHFLFFRRPLAAPVPVPVVPSVPSRIKIVATVAVAVAAAAAAVSTVASAAFSALIVANLSPSFSDKFLMLLWLLC